MVYWMGLVPCCGPDGYRAQVPQHYKSLNNRYLHHSTVNCTRSNTFIKIDDPLDAVAVHGNGGLIGLILAPFFMDIGTFSFF